MNVTIKDGTGAIVGVGTTEHLAAEDIVTTDGTLPEHPSQFQTAILLDPINEYRQCYVKFEVPIKKADFYQITVGKRGDLSYSYDELKKRDFFVELTLGASA